MAATPEGIVKRKCKVVIDKYPGVYYITAVPGGYGQSTLDMTLCVRGLFVSIEAKAPGEWLTGRQRVIAWRIVEAGGKVFVISGDEGLQALDRWLRITYDQHSDRQGPALAGAVPVGATFS